MNAKHVIAASRRWRRAPSLLAQESGWDSVDKVFGLAGRTCSAYCRWPRPTSCPGRECRPSPRSLAVWGPETGAGGEVDGDLFPLA